MTAKLASAPPAAARVNVLWAWREFQHDVRANLAARGFSAFDRPLFPGQRGSDRVHDLLTQKQPMLCARFGFLERECAWFFHQHRAEGRPYPDRILRTMSNNAGFFPATHENLDRYCHLYLDALREVNLMCVWLLENEAEMCRTFCPSADLTDPRGYEPYYVRRPWSAALAGRRVLVIHPFANSIERQYRTVRRSLFSNCDTLPEFELKTLPAVVSLAGTPVPFPDWFAALESMQQAIQDCDFDVALIGAGAYGLVLGTFVKRLGKQAIHLGGAVQILFGIKGRRWDNYPRSARLYNNAWVRPLPEEIPGGAQKVEQGCYW